jgi:acetylornithine/succinyldiaminopimelate/putrescine aminotransferase
MHLTPKQLFLHSLAQTNPAPLALEIQSAKDSFLYDIHGNQFLDLISGISVCSLGHQNEQVVNAIIEQVKKHMHVMVYGETVQMPQNDYAAFLIEQLPPQLNNVYFVNSGSEAIDAAMKLAKRTTGLPGFVAQTSAYHGSSQGPLSLMNDDYYVPKYRPLLNQVFFIEQNNVNQIQDLPKNGIAAVVLELIQAEKGVSIGEKAYIHALYQYAKSIGALFVVDEIQTGFGRTGTKFCFEQYEIIPDILVLGKALGGGMPMGAIIANKDLMHQFASNPILGHITTFGGHPVSCAAGLATNQLLFQSLAELNVPHKEHLFKSLLVHPKIKKVTGKGLLLACHLVDELEGPVFIHQLLEQKLFTDWFLFETNAIRISPPLTISEDEIRKACQIILTTLNTI